MKNYTDDKNIKLIREKIKKTKSREIEIDLTSMNVFEASKMAILSSALYYSKEPEGKIKCRLESDNIKSFISGLAIGNIEFI